MAPKEKRRILIYSSRGQGVFLVLYALRELEGRCTKREVITFIQDADLYDITKHDLPAYANQGEPKYHTLLAWARKDAAIAGWIAEISESDAWQISREGRQLLERVIQAYREGKHDVRKCYLWTPKFKKQIVPTYEPSEMDALRREVLLDAIIAEL